MFHEQLFKPMDHSPSKIYVDYQTHVTYQQSSIMYHLINHEIQRLPEILIWSCADKYTQPATLCGPLTDK